MYFLFMGYLFIHVAEYSRTVVTYLAAFVSRQYHVCVYVHVHYVQAVDNRCCFDVHVHVWGVYKYI